MVDAVDLAYLEALSDEEVKLTRQIIAARKYHTGSQNVALTERLKQYVGETFSGFEFRLNIVKTIVRAVTEKLGVVGFDCEEPEAIAWAEKVWQHNQMDSRQDDVFEAALRDGSCYVIVDWPAESQYPRWVPQQQYTSAMAGGDGLGCHIYYQQDDPNLDPIMGVKYWTERIKGKYIQRRTLYYPDRVEKWARTGGGGDWAHFSDPDDVAWPIPWVDAEGNPLGIAVVPFYNKGMLPEAYDAFPLQDAANKVVVDLLSTEDQTAYRVLVALGFIPTSDGLELRSDRSNALEIEPGVIVGTTKTKAEADFRAIEPARLTPIMDMVQQLILWIALVTDTPVSRFITTKLIASDETLKQQEAPLIAKVEARQKLFSTSIMQCMDLSARLARAYGVADQVPPAGVAIKPIWKSAQSLRERLEELTLKQSLGVPEVQLWAELGYGQDKVDAWTRLASTEGVENGN